MKKNRIIKVKSIENEQLIMTKIVTRTKIVITTVIITIIIKKVSYRESKLVIV